MGSHITDFIVVCVLLCGLGCSTTSAGSYEYNPEYLLPSVCPECEAKSCPQLTYCAGVVVKDHCGCCNRCSSDLFQPHVQNTMETVEPPSVKPEEAPTPGKIRTLVGKGTVHIQINLGKKNFFKHYNRALAMLLNITGLL